jgi:hypothetical protein
MDGQSSKLESWAIYTAAATEAATCRVHFLPLLEKVVGKKKLKLTNLLYMNHYGSLVAQLAKGYV